MPVDPRFLYQLARIIDSPMTTPARPEALKDYMMRFWTWSTDEARRTHQALNTIAGSTVAGAIANASYITIDNEPGLTEERRLVAAAPVTRTDAGPNSTVTIGITTSALSPQPLGTAAPGATGQVSDAGHIHPIGNLVTGPGPLVTDLSIPIWNGTGGTTLTSQGAWIISAIGGHLTPTTNNLFDIGTTTNKVRDVRISRDLFVDDDTTLIGQVLVGQPTPIDPSFMLQIHGKTSTQGEGFTALFVRGELDADQATFSSSVASNYEFSVLDGYNNTVGSSQVTSFVSFLDLNAPTSAKANAVTCTAADFTISGAMNAADVLNLVGFGMSSFTCTPNPASATAIRVSGVPTTTGTGRFGIDVNGPWHVPITNILGFGRNVGISPTNWLVNKTSTGQIIVMALNSQNVAQFENSAVNNALNFWMRDRSSATERYVKLTMNSASSALTGDRVLTIDVGNTDRTITLSGNPTLANWFDQDLRTTASPTWVDPIVNTIKINDSDDSHQLQILVSSNLTAARTLTLTPGDANRSITLGGNVTFPSGSPYTPTNVTTDRSYDANATTLDEIADVLGTLIADLQTAGAIT